MTDPAPAAPKTPLELPMASWVKGGTTTARHDAQVAAARADAERRRTIEDNRQRFALSNPQEAKIRALNLTDSRQHPIVMLFVKRPEDLVCEMTCELIMRPTTELFRGEKFQWLLQIVCPACVYRNGRLMSESQLSIQQINRYFWLDKKREGELYVTPSGDAYTLAGTIHTQDWIRCDHLGCGFRFRISNSEIISGT